MPKKRHTNLFSKPPSTVHQSPSSSLFARPSNLAASSSDNDSPKSVNELLTSLRAVQITPENRGELPSTIRTLPTPIRQLLDLPETPAPRPRIRTGAPRYGTDGRRLPAGPLPPQSWLDASMWAFHHGSKDEQTYIDGQPHTRAAKDHLPGILKWPSEKSLLSLVLRQLARNWDFHEYYDQHHLASLPTSLRTLLLSYLAAHGPRHGLGYTGLKLILRAEESSDFKGNEDFDRLDLAGSLGRELSLKNIKDFIASPNETKVLPDEQADWDETPPPAMSMKITNLRYLSLANPGDIQGLWSSLLGLATFLPTLTHLSLAHWPTPELNPNSRTVTMQSSMHRPVGYSATGFYAHTLDQDWSEAAGILRRLSTSLYSLQWLDLTGCSVWVKALRWSSTPGIDWKGKWGRVRTLRLQSDIDVLDESRTTYSTDVHVTPSNIPDKNAIIQHKLRIVEAMEVEKWIRQLRGWIDVQYDDFEAYDSYLEGYSKGEAKVLNAGLLNRMKVEYAREGEAYERSLRDRWYGDDDD